MPRPTPREGLPASGEEPVWTARKALHTRAFWLLTVAFTLTSLPASSIFVHMAPYIATKGFSIAAGATAVSIYGFGVLGGRFVWGLLIARVGIYRALVAFGFIYAISIVAFLLPSSLTGIYAMTVLLGLSIAGGQQLQAQAFPDYFGRAIVGALLGYSGLFFTVARAGAPLFAAFVYDATQSYVFAFALFAAACVIAGVALLLAPPPVHPRRRACTVTGRG
jgi:MFS family permease